MAISKIFARQIFDSRGNPTVEVDLTTELGMFRAAVPSGASTGIHEALELRDNIKADYHGKGVSKAIKNINDIIAPAFVGKDIDICDQAAVDKILIDMDGTDNKAKLGANAILGVSMAVCKAAAAKKNIPLYQHIANLAGGKVPCLPVPCFNIINGGSHAGNRLAMQEFMLMPIGAKNLTHAMKIATEVYHHLKNVIKEKYGLDACNVGDEGGFAPNIQSNEEGLNLVVAAIKRAGYVDECKIGMDVAAAEFYKDGKYDLDFKNPESNPTDYKSGDELIAMYKGFMANYPVVSIEDPFDEDDWENFAKMTTQMGAECQIVGDDLLVTNPRRIQRAINEGSCNSLLLKINQIGSITEAITACNLAQSKGWSVMVSHRSGETEDTFIADLVVGLRAGQIKTGAPCRSERLAKYNQLLRIEEQMGAAATYTGKDFRNPL